ncbi:MAG: hypothetical protein P1V81_07290 [Planctomycetota bacterium]|nr:hypothetical protein [Planctomycetota bacterium]
MKPSPLTLLVLALTAFLAWGLDASEPALAADRLSVSLSRGGEQELVIDAGPAFAGKRYLIVGSSSGSFPGTLQGGVRVPVNYDSYSDLLLRSLHTPAYTGFEGYLDSLGRAKAKLRMPGTTSTTFVGTVYHHAAVILDGKDQSVVAATNAVEVLLLP